MSTTINQQALSVQSDNDNKINDTQVASSTFLINMNNNNSSNISTSRLDDGTSSQNHKIHLASPNGAISNALASNDETKGLKFQTGKSFYNSF